MAYVFTFTKVLEEWSIMCQHNQGGFTRHLFNHPSICKVCFFVFPFAPVETSIYSERGKHPTLNVASTLRFVQHFIMSLHQHTLNRWCAIFISRLKFHSTILPGITFPQHVACFNCRYAMALVLDSMLTFFTIQRKYDEKTRLVKHLGPAKCRTPKCKHRLATPPLAQCKCKNVCDKAVVGQAYRWHHLLLINCLKKQKFFGEPNYQVHTWHTNPSMPLVISSGTCSQVVCPPERRWFLSASDPWFFPCMVEIDCNWSTPSSWDFSISKFVRNIFGKKKYWHPCCFLIAIRLTCKKTLATMLEQVRRKSGRQGRRCMPAASPRPHFRGFCWSLLGGHPWGHHFAASEFMRLGIKNDNFVGP